MSDATRRPTMVDVARLAGVSLKTVSRVVNAEGGVSEDLVRRVEDAVSALHYQLDFRARDLRQGDAGPNTVGFVLVDVANPFFSAALRGLEEVARSRNCLVLSGSSDGDESRQTELIRTFISRRVAGLVVVLSGDGLGAIGPEILRDTPVVFFDREPADLAADIVCSDHEGGTALITAHLLRHGHRHIAFLGDSPSVVSAKLRQTGFRRTMADAGQIVDETWVVTGGYTPSEWRRQVRSRLERAESRPTALVAAMNFACIGAVQALHDLGLHHQIAIAGFDEVEFGDVLDPAITVIPQQPFELGRRAGELLFRRIDRETSLPVREILTNTVIARGSGEIPGPRS